MKYLLVLLVACASSVYAAEDYSDVVCGSYDVEKDKKECFDEFAAEKTLQDRRDKAAKSAQQEQLTNNKLAADKAKADECLKSRECLISGYFSVAEYQCPAIIERMAKYDLKWTDGWTGFKFRSNPLKVGDGYVIRFQGDKLKMQNGFGAWSNVVYNCDIDILAGRIVDAGAAEGRL